jgi:diaminopimelate decarboxylase
MNNPNLPFLTYRDQRLYMDEVDLARVAQAVGTPCYVYSQPRLLANLNQLRAAFPTAEIHYSLKANANLALIRALHEAGIGFDAVSAGEIYRALQAGVSPSQIVFAGVGKTLDELTFALAEGVGWFNVESSQELDRLLALLAATPNHKPAKIALRLNPDVHADTHKHIDTGHADSKFGIPLAEAHLLLAAHGGQISGLHVHIGSQIGNPQRIVDVLTKIALFYRAYPFLSTLDLGGGFPVAYTDAPAPAVSTFGQAVESFLAALESELGRKISLLLEPGRFLVADTGVLLTEVQYIKPTPSGHIAVCDAGMTELIRPALYGASHGVLPLVASPAPPTPVQIVGPVCESADVLRADALLPALQQGDLLAMLHVGAYGAVMASHYNARPNAPEVLVMGEQWRLIRRRQTWRDLVAAELDLAE